MSNSIKVRYLSNLVYSRLVAILLIVLGVTVTYGWHTHEPSLIQVFPEFVPMQYNTALGFIFAGTGLLIGHNKIVTQSMAGLLGLVGTVSLLQYLIGFDAGIDQLFMDHYILTQTSHSGRMAPNTALGFTLTAIILGLFNNKQFSPDVRIFSDFIFGGLIVSLGLMALAGYLLGLETAFGWGHYTRMAVHTSIGFILIGSSIISLTVFTFRRRVKEVDWLTSLAALGMTTLIIVFWQASTSYEAASIRRAVTENVNALKISIDILADPSELAFTRLSERWLGSNQEAKAIWTADTSSYLRDQPWIHSLSWVDRNGKYQWITQRNDNYLGIGNDLSKTLLDATILQKIKNNPIPVITNLSESPYGESVFALIKPLFTKEGFDGYLVGIVDIGILFSPIVQTQQQAGFYVVVRQNGSVILQTNTKITDTLSNWGQTFSVHRNGNDWDIMVAPSASFVESIRSPLPTLILAGGSILSILLVLVVRFARRVKERSRSLLQAQSALETSEEKQRAIVNNVADGIITINHKGIIQFFSQSAERMFGYKTEDVIGENIKILMPAEIAGKHDDILENYSRTGVRTIIGNLHQVPARRKDGTMFTAELAVRELRIRNEILFTSLIKDITERKQAEDELNRAKEKAEAANAAKSSFLANMSHEIRTPMNAIIGFNDLLLKMDDLPSDAVEYSQQVADSSRALLGILNDILDYSKVEANKLELSFTEFDVEYGMATTKKLFHMPAQEKNIGLVTKLGLNLSRYYIGDPMRIGQIINNLVGNAVKFTNKGQVTIHVKEERISDKHCTLIFEVSDTGIGMTQDQMSLLFQPFTQADATITRKYGGTGLGLSICKKLSNLMGGTLSVSSVPEEGSTFTLSLPLEKASKASACKLPVNTPQDYTNILTDATVLLAEDNPINQLLARKFLATLGVHLTVVENGQQAIDAVKSTPYDIILMDLQMPVKDGFQATKEIRLLDNGRSVPIIAVSAAAFDEDIKKALSVGIDAHVSKPIDADRLCETIYNLYKKDPNKGPGLSNHQQLDKDMIDAEMIG